MDYTEIDFIKCLTLLGCFMLVFWVSFCLGHVLKQGLNGVLIWVKSTQSQTHSRERPIAADQDDMKNDRTVMLHFKSHKSPRMCSAFFLTESPSCSLFISSWTTSRERRFPFSLSLSDGLVLPVLSVTPSSLCLPVHYSTSSWHINKLCFQYATVKCFVTS